MPSQDPKAMVQKLWDFCDVLRDDGLSYRAGGNWRRRTRDLVEQVKDVDSCFP